MFDGSSSDSERNESSGSLLPLLNHLVSIVPNLTRTNPLLSHVNLIKNSVRLVARNNDPSVLDLVFNFDVTSNCIIKVLYCVDETSRENCIEYRSALSGEVCITPSYEGINLQCTERSFSGNSNRNLEHVCTSPLQSTSIQTSNFGCHFVQGNFASGLGQTFSTCNSHALDTSIYPPELLLYNQFSKQREIDIEAAHLNENADGNCDKNSRDNGSVSQTPTPETARALFPIVVIIEPTGPNNDSGTLGVLHDARQPKDHVSSQITQLIVCQNQDGSYEARVLRQKVLIDGVAYKIYDIYGIELQPHGTEEKVLDGSYEGPAECVICMSEPRNTLVVPCRHMCLCNECAETLKYQSVKCPICRSPVRLLLTVNLNSGDQEAMATKKCTSNTEPFGGCNDKTIAAMTSLNIH